MLKLRLDNAEHQKRSMSHNAMVTPLDKLSVFAVQGFGRFGPFGPSKSDSTERYQLAQDWGLILWSPLVLFGLYVSFRAGLAQLREGRPPTSPALVIWAFIAWAVVGIYLPMAWDRYLLPIQVPNALLAAVGAVALYDSIPKACSARGIVGLGKIGRVFSVISLCLCASVVRTRPPRSGPTAPGNRRTARGKAVSA